MLHEILQAAFKKSGYRDMKDWHTATKCPLSYFTVTSIINQDKEPAIPTFIVIAYLLDIPIKDIAEACKAAGDTVFHRILTEANHGKR
jgi:hypothetical protein